MESPVVKLNSVGDKIRADYGFFQVEKDENVTVIWKSVGDWVKWAESSPSEIRSAETDHFSNQ